MYSRVLHSFFFQAEDGIRDLVRSRGLGDVYKRQDINIIDDFECQRNHLAIFYGASDLTVINNPNITKVILDPEDGFLLSSEINILSNEPNNEFDYFKYALGAWYYTNKFDKLMGNDNNGNPLKQLGNYGVYLSVEKLIYSENKLNNQGLTAFLRIGLADNNVNQVDGYFGTGINYIGLIPGRNEDILGFAISTIHNSYNFRQLNLSNEPYKIIENYEYIFELTYNLTLFEFLNIQPDIQYIINPVLCYHNNFSIAFGTRFKILF